MGKAPTRFTIRPDDYHVPYAGTAEDGRKFFLSGSFSATTPAGSGSSCGSPMARSMKSRSAPSGEHLDCRPGRRDLLTLMT